MYLICGEALFDFFLEGETSPGAATFAARAGGSPFNVALGIVRLGGKAALLTGLSTDMMGERLYQILRAEGVDCAYLIRSPRPTTLSLVGRNAGGGPDYAFYGENTADRDVRPEDLPDLGSEIKGLHFGSYSIAVRPVADAFYELAAQNRERFLSLDPNVRPTVEPDLDVWRRQVEKFVPLADLVKISTEDLAILYPGRPAQDYAAGLFELGVDLVVVTGGENPVCGWTRAGVYASVQPPQVEIVDTVGAGDSFHAALLAQLGEGGDPAAKVAALTNRSLEQLLRFAAGAAAVTCARRGADLPRAGEVKF